MRKMWALQLLLVALPLLIKADRLAVLQASYRTERIFNSTTFHHWFRLADTPYNIMCANPGLTRVDRLSKRTFRGYLTPVRAPGLDIHQVIDFDVSANATAFTIRIDQGKMVSTYKGAFHFTLRNLN